LILLHYFELCTLTHTYTHTRWTSSLRTAKGPPRTAHLSDLPRPGDIQAQPEVEGNTARQKAAREAFGAGDNLVVMWAII
jgi:hypothetical protein